MWSLTLTTCVNIHHVQNDSKTIGRIDDSVEKDINHTDLLYVATF